MQLGLDVSDNSKETVIGTIPMDWDAVPFGELAIDFFSGGTPSTKEPEFWDGDIPWTTSAYIGDRLYLGQGAKFITSSGLEKSSSKLVPAGNLLIGTRVGVGKVAINLTDIAISQDLTGAIVDRTKVCPEFLAYAIRSAGVQEVIQSRTRGTTIKGIPRKDLEQVSIPLPPLDEQHRIAHVLNAIQRAIEVQDQVIAAARNLKRSLMRHLFTYGPVPLDQVEQVPLKETEIGPVPEHWDVVRLGGVVDVKGGKRLPKGHKFADGPTDHPYIRVVDFKNNSVDKTDLRFVTPEDYERINRYTISAEDVYVSIAGTTGLVGTVPEDLDGANLTENATKLVIKDKRRLLKHFLVYALASEGGQMEIRQRTTKTSQPKLALMRIKQIPILFPSPTDQRRIAEMLSSMDRKIKAEERRKAALQALFKTMLHQLMTGQLRVPDPMEVPQ